MSELAQDLHYAVRTLSKSPGFTLVAVLTLMIGIGSVVAIFSIADTALLNPLPFPHSERLVTVNEVVLLIGDRPIRVTAPDLVDFENESHSFEALGGWRTPEPPTVELSGGHESMRVSAVRVTPSIFRVLGIAPLMGRTFTREEDSQGETVCVISYGLWQRWFGADPQVVGGTLDLDRVPYKIIGVMPLGFEFPLRGNPDAPNSADIWVPLSLTPKQLAQRADNWSYNSVARMKPGVSIQQASADVNAIAQRIVAKRLPAEAAGFRFSALARPMAEQVSGRVRTLVLTLLAAVCFVLLIACANVANLLLARGQQREREIAVRVALGASRARILRQLMAETLVLAGVAASAGGLLAWWSTQALLRFVPTRFAVLRPATFDWRVLMFTMAIALITAVAVGFVPGLTATACLPFMSQKEHRELLSGVRRQRLRSGLVILEMALAVVLLVGAGLLIRSFQQLLRTDPGFAPENAVAGYVSLPENQYSDAAHERRFYRELLERLHAVPGTEFEGMASALPLHGPRSQRSFWPDDYNPPPNETLPVASMTVVDGQWFQALGATLMRGRFFTPHDSAQAPPVGIITQSFAKQYWHGTDPIGKRLYWGTQQSNDRTGITVVGVVADLKQDALESANDPQILVPAEQAELGKENPASVSGDLRSMYVVVRGRGEAEFLIAGVRNAVHEIDSRLAVGNLEPLKKTVAASVAPQRFNMLMMTGFGAIALLLAAIGIYGLISYSVAQRTHEIGIRMALGASAQGVARMVLRSALMLAIEGVAIGAIAAAGVAPLLKALLFGVKPLDWVTFAAVATGLLAVVALASYVPARRATKVDPMVALRYE